MQTLWSRAAQVQSSCRCRTYLPSTNSTIRRTTTAAPRRKVTFADVFTACYTTILGTAAIIDARRKDEKRRELDGELDRVKASLKQVAGEKGTKPSSLLPTFITGRESTQPLLDELKALCNITHRPLVHESWLQNQINWSNIEAAIAAEEKDIATVLLEPMTEQSLASTTTTVLELVDELLLRTQTPESNTRQENPQISEHVENSILRELEEVRHGSEFPCYQFPTDDPSYSTHVRRLLNESLRRIFNQANSTQETVGKICYNLLTIGVPPTIHTFNTLIAGFNRIQRPELAQVVINSYLDKSGWPATDQTLVCLLSHYRGPGGLEGMRDAVRRMRGLRRESQRLATVNRVRLLNARQRRAFDEGWFAVKADRNDYTFDCLIKGWLYHENVLRACTTFIACMRKGGYIPVYTLHELFRGCLETADSSSARKLVVGILKNYENFTWYLASIIDQNTTVIVRQILQSLHQIIAICWLPFGSVYGQTYEQYAAEAASLKGALKQMDSQLEIYESAQLPPPVSNALTSDKSLPSRFETAISSPYAVKSKRRTTPVLEEIYIRLAMLVSIERRFIDLEERYQDHVAAFNAIMIRVKTGFNLDWGNILLSAPCGWRASRGRMSRRFALRQALDKLDVWHSALTREDVALHFFRRIPNPALIRQLEMTDQWKNLRIAPLLTFHEVNAVLPPANIEEACDTLLGQLELQIQAAQDSIRALLFTEIRPYLQIRCMWYYRGYYKIPTEKLCDYVGRTIRQRVRKEARLLRELLNSTTDLVRYVPVPTDLVHINEHQAYPLLSVLREGGPRDAALG